MKKKGQHHADMEPVARLRKICPGCANCYVYRRDESIGKDASVVAKRLSPENPALRERWIMKKAFREVGNAREAPAFVERFRAEKSAFGVRR